MIIIEGEMSNEEKKRDRKSLLIAAPLLAGVQNFPGVTQHLRTDGTDSFVGLIVLVLLTSALVDH